MESTQNVKRAVVMRGFGDPAMVGAIMDGMTQKMIPLDAGELTAVKAELGRLQVRHGLMVYGNERRFKAAARRKAIKYRVKPVGPVKGAILGLWGLVWLGIARGWDRMTALNRR